MNWLKQFVMAASVSLVLWTNGADAGYQYGSDDDSCCYQYGFLPAEHQISQCDSGFSVSAEWLYWKACGNGLPFGVEKHVTFTEGTDAQRGDLHVCARSKCLDYSWDSGFRIGLGYITPCEGWDVALKWTYFQTDATSRHHHDCEDCNGSCENGCPEGAGSRTIFVPCFTSIPADLAPTCVRGKWDLDLNVVDLELGRDSRISPCLNLRPYAALRYFNADQKAKFHHSSEETVAPFSGARFAYDDYVRLKKDYKAFGLGLGLGTTWKLGSCINLHVNGFGALVYGDHDFKAHECYRPHEDAPIADASVDFSHRGCDRRHCVETQYGLEADLAWATSFCNDQQSLEIAVGYGFYDWGEFAHSSLPKARDVDSWSDSCPGKRGSLTTQGWKLRGTYIF